MKQSSELKTECSSSIENTHISFLQNSASMRTYSMMREKQVNLNLLNVSKEIKELRTNLIYGDICQICFKMNLSPNCYFLSIYLFDYLISYFNIPVDKIKIVFVTCLSLASKTLESFETYIDLTMINKLYSKYSIEALVSLEKFLFSLFEFKLNFPTAYDFLELIFFLVEDGLTVNSNCHYTKLNIPNLKEECKAKLLTVLVDGRINCSNPDTIALAVLISVFDSNGLDIFRIKNLKKIILSQKRDFERCLSFCKTIFQEVSMEIQ